MKRKALVFLTIASMLVSQAAFAFAEDNAGSSQETTVPDGMEHISENVTSVDTDIDGIITTKATGVGLLDFLISEKISMGATEGKQKLTVTPLTVKNQLDTGTIQVSNIRIKGDNEWLLVKQASLGNYDKDEDTYKYFKDKEANTKEFYLAVQKSDGTDCEGTYDDKTKICVYSQSFPQVDNATDIVIGFSGYTGLITKSIEEEKAANIVVTVSIVDANDDSAEDKSA